LRVCTLPRCHTRFNSAHNPTHSPCAVPSPALLPPFLIPHTVFRPKKPTRGHTIVASSQVCNVCLSVLLHIPDHWLTMPLIRSQNVSTNFFMLENGAFRTSDRCVVYSVPSSYFSLPFTGLDLSLHASRLTA